MKTPYFPIIKNKINIQSNDILYDEDKKILIKIIVKKFLLTFLIILIKIY